MGFEPMTFSLWNWRDNHFSTPQCVYFFLWTIYELNVGPIDYESIALTIWANGPIFNVYPVRFELTTLRLKGGCSQALRNQLSYGCINYSPSPNQFGNSHKGESEFNFIINVLCFSKKKFRRKLEEIILNFLQDSNLLLFV